MYSKSAKVITRKTEWLGEKMALTRRRGHGRQNRRKQSSIVPWVLQKNDGNVKKYGDLAFSDALTLPQWAAVEGYFAFCPLNGTIFFWRHFLTSRSFFRLIAFSIQWCCHKLDKWTLYSYKSTRSIREEQKRWECALSDLRLWLHLGLVRVRKARFETAKINLCLLSRSDGRRWLPASFV